MRILKDNTFALIIDIQEKLFPHIHENNRLLENTQKLVAGLKILNIPIKITEQYKRGLGDTLPEISTHLQGCTFFEKKAFSCCDDEAIMENLNASSRQTVILTGIEAHICVMQTAIDLLAKGFRPVIVEDCVASRKPDDKRISINRMLHAGITVTSYESLLFELCRYSGTEEFKAISKIVK